MAKQSPVEAPAISNEPADRKVAEARPDGVIIDHRTGTISAPKKPFIQQMMEHRNRAHTGTVSEKPGLVPRRSRIADPRTHDTAHVVVPRQVMNRLADKADVTRADVEVRVEEELAKMSVRSRIRFACAKAMEKAPIWVQISAVWRSGEHAQARDLALDQFHEEATTHTGKAACVKWARRLREDVVQPLESGDFQKPDEIAYHLLKLATERGRSTKEMKAEFLACRLNPTPATHDIVREDVVVDGLPPSADDYVDPPAPKAAVASPVAAPAPKAEVTDELEDADTEEVPLPVAVDSPPVADPAPEAPKAEETENAPVMPDEPAPVAKPEPTPTPTQAVDEDTLAAAKLAGCSVEDFLAKPAPLRLHFRRQVAQNKAAKPAPKPVAPTSASSRKGGRTSMTLADLKVTGGAE